jgi:hypothetical protein
MSAERQRLAEHHQRIAYWKKWGPYLSERQWGTVREDYSENGDAWRYVTHDMARSRAYRWGEDGIAGISDHHQRLCFALCVWNQKDPILKERLFGLSNPEGNHGEDVKEYYYYLDNTPSHAYMKYLYKYPQRAYPYSELVEKNQVRTQAEREYELIDTGIFEGNRYFDIFIEYAKVSPLDIYIKISVHNQGPDTCTLDLLPTLWFRNTWSWQKGHVKPQITKGKSNKELASIYASSDLAGNYVLYGASPKELLFTENETNENKIFGKAATSPYSKDSFHRYLIDHEKEAVNPKECGTKVCFHYQQTIAANQTIVTYMRLSNQLDLKNPLSDAEKIFNGRIAEANEFYDEILPPKLSPKLKNIQRQAIAGVLWNKQFYYYVIDTWLHGDAVLFPQKLIRQNPRNQDWLHLYNDDILSVPDKWEYPALFSWDNAFHSVIYAIIDPDFAKRQLMLLTREWYMHPNGQLPAYEWNFNDVNPPVHAWATWRVYKIEKKYSGREDRSFLESVFQKLLMNFTWWVNRQDASGRNVFQGGFLGLDNISVFNRSEQIPAGGLLYQADATSWMGMYCLDMLTIALELAVKDKVYEDMASKFYEHFLHIADAINFKDKEGRSFPLWHEEDGFYYDVLVLPCGEKKHLRVHSLVGLIPLLAVMTIEQEVIDSCPGFKKRMEWFMQHRQDLCSKIANSDCPGEEDRKLLALMRPEQLQKVLKIMLDEGEFLSPYGLRSISKRHKNEPYQLKINEHYYSVDYEPGESKNKMFGGNSNWRGPVWFPINMLIIEALQKYHHYFGDSFQVECPTGSGHMMTLWQIAAEISKRLVSIFTEDEKGRRPCFGNKELFQTDPNFKDYLFFNEYFHGDTGEGLGAIHQTGWTALVAKLIRQCAEYHDF